MNLKLVFALVLIAFAVALAVVIGNRVSADALALLLGVACGAGIALPIVGISLYFLSRSQGAHRSRPEQRLSHPPIVVIGPGSERALPWPRLDSPSRHLEREFHMVGDEEDVNTWI